MKYTNVHPVREMQTIEHKGEIMARNMSFAMTIEQMQRREKTVTRRFGWHFLKPGDEIRAVQKAMGLRKGEKIKPIGMIRVISTGVEPLCTITADDCIKEGFPDKTPAQFVAMLQLQYGCSPVEKINRIEFEHI